ncbi:hypothetical protein Moror_2602 [Moniliophthora roreri MCA 2997]|uniref:Reverse transcriptase-rnase h-integrase n=1 Tax=Moniliophthora roreri (strain MCA 2997) TaxID=1381753 RepID=V2XFA6_MONRO|nr:hypothetical protein Moror_2602 [Moniliophthora roreri MCA 2997]
MTETPLLLVPAPSSTLNPQAPPVTVIDPLSLNISLPPTLEVHQSMLDLLVSTPHPPPILVPRPSNLIWRVSTPPEFRDVRIVTPLPHPITSESEADASSPRQLQRDVTERSVWDNEVLKEALLREPSSTPNNNRDMTDEVHEYLSALCAEWRTTAAKTAHTTIVKFVGHLHLVTSLKIVISNNSHEELLENTIPNAQGLLTTIAMGMTSTLTSMEMENSNPPVEQEDAEEQYKWVYTGQQESFREVTLSDGTVARLEYHP